MLRFEHAAQRAMKTALGILKTSVHRSELTWKGNRDFATQLDFDIERKLKDQLIGDCPETSFLGEEESADTELKGLVWVLDPIDGTVNFSRGSPLYGVSLALTLDGEAIVSTVEFPNLGRNYSAVKGKGAFLNGNRIMVSNTKLLSESIVSAGDFAVRGDIEARNKERLMMMKLLSEECLRVRMLGTAALDLCLVADGTHDALVMLSNNAWDVQGGTLIVREAGGVVFDSKGKDHGIDSKQTICCGSSLKSHLTDLAGKAVSS